MNSNILKDYKVILLDMNGTFMFGEDRFDESENFGEIYRAIAGSCLADQEVNRIIRNTFNSILENYRNPEIYNNFPQVDSILAKHTTAFEPEVSLLLKTFALHERGIIPIKYADFLKNLSLSHNLGLVSNIWSSKDYWLDEFERLELSEIFNVMVFSSDFHFIKPSPEIYTEALKHFNCDKSDVLFIGDSLRYDIEGANNIGIDTAWINKEMYESEGKHPLATYLIPDLFYLELP